MNLKSKKLLAAKLLDAGLDRVWIDPNNSTSVKEAVTKDDIRNLISKGIILVKQKKGVSRGRARRFEIQRRKGRSSGDGSRKGKKTARLGRKEAWVNLIRAQRELFLELLNSKSISNTTYRTLRIRAKGGFFRSRRHIKLYLTEHNLWETKK